MFFIKGIHKYFIREIFLLTHGRMEIVKLEVYIITFFHYEIYFRIFRISYEQYEIQVYIL